MPGGVSDDELQAMFDNLTTNSTEAQIHQELSNLLDFTQKETKRFIKEFVEKVK